MLHTVVYLVLTCFLSVFFPVNMKGKGSVNLQDFDVLKLLGTGGELLPLVILPAVFFYQGVTEHKNKQGSLLDSIV